MRRATANCRPTIMVSHNVLFADLLLDFAVGEPGQERKVLEVTRPGSFQFPEVVGVGQRVSVRVRKSIPPGFKVEVRWEPVQ
jgi:hypothetical protein